MPNVVHLQTNFTSGEISPRLFGRVDLAKYNSGAKTIENAVVQTHGGITRRTGTRFAAEMKNADDSGAVAAVHAYTEDGVSYSCTPRLVEFHYNTEQSYVLEIGVVSATLDTGTHGYIRFYRMVGTLPTLLLDTDIAADAITEKVNVPINAKELTQLKFTQSADTMYMFCPTRPILKLTRTGSDTASSSWEFTALEGVDNGFIDGPYLDMNSADIKLKVASADGEAGDTTTVTAWKDPYDIDTDVDADGTPDNYSYLFQTTDIGRVIRLEDPIKGYKVDRFHRSAAGGKLGASIHLDDSEENPTFAELVSPLIGSTFPKVEFYDCTRGITFLDDTLHQAQVITKQFDEHSSFRLYHASTGGPEPYANTEGDSPDAWIENIDGFVRITPAKYSGWGVITGVSNASSDPAATATIVGTADLDAETGTNFILTNTDGSTVTFTTDPTLNFGDVTADIGDPAATATIVGTASLDDEDGTNFILTNADDSTVTFHTDPTKNFGDTSDDGGDHTWIVNTRDISGGSEVRKATQALWTACKAAIDAGELDMTIVPTSFAGTETSFTLTQTTVGTAGNTAITLVTGVTADGETSFTGGFDGQRWRVNTRDISGGSEVRKSTQALWIACKGAIDAGELDMTIVPTSFAGTEEEFTLTQTTPGTAGKTAITLSTGVTADGETAFTDGADYYATATIIVKSKFISDEMTQNWRLGAWSETTGYPQNGTFHQNRLWCAATTTQPQTLWASEVNVYDTFSPSDPETNQVVDSTSLALTLSSRQVNAINHMKSDGQGLMVFTSGGEWLGRATNPTAPITPTDVAFQKQSSYGSIVGVEPVRMGTSYLLFQRDAVTLREYTYQFGQDRFVAPNITLIAEHITRNKVVDTTFQLGGTQRLWCVSATGELLTLTYDKEQEVVAWSKHTMGASGAGGSANTAGLVQSVARTMDGNDDNIWLAVKRKIGTADKYFVEMIAQDFEVTDDHNVAFFVDCGLSGYSADGETNWTGLDHLNGEAVYALVDGVQYGPFTVGSVTGGTGITTVSANYVQVGLRYETVIETVPLNVQQTLESRGRRKRVFTSFLSMYRALSGKAGTPDQVYNIEYPTATTTPPPLNSGLFEISIPDNSDREMIVRYEQEDVHPANLLAITSEIQLGSI